jgi:hypothetical protein
MKWHIDVQQANLRKTEKHLTYIVKASSKVARLSSTKAPCISPLVVGMSLRAGTKAFLEWRLVIQQMQRAAVAATFQWSCLTLSPLDVSIMHEHGCDMSIIMLDIISTQCVNHPWAWMIDIGASGRDFVQDDFDQSDTDSEVDRWAKNANLPFRRTWSTVFQCILHVALCAWLFSWCMCGCLCVPGLCVHVCAIRAILLTRYIWWYTTVKIGEWGTPGGPINKNADLVYIIKLNKIDKENIIREKHLANSISRLALMRTVLVCVPLFL